MSATIDPALGPAAQPAPLPDWLDRIGERANPILVRYIRQRLRSRVFLGMFCLLLASAAVTTLVLAGEASFGQPTGLQLYGVLAAFWSFAAWVYEPVSVYNSVVAEHEEKTWDLLRLTGMSPWRVVSGFLLGSVVQGMLYASAFAPFMIMAYYLLGVQLQVLVGTILMIPAFGLAACSGGALAASLATSRALRALLAVALAAAALGVWSGFASFWFEPREIGRLMFALSAEPTAVLVRQLGAVANLWLACTALMVVLCVAAMTPRTANRSTGPRFVLFAIFVNGALWVLAPGIYSYSTGYAAAFVALFGAMLTNVLGLFAVTEDWVLTARQRRFYDSNPLLRALTFPLGPGAATGRVAWLIMAAATGALTIMAATSGSRFMDEATVARLVLCYGAIYLLAGDTLGRRCPERIRDDPRARRLVVIALVAVMCAVAIIVPQVLGDRRSGIAMLAPLPGAFIGTSPSQGTAAQVVYLLGGASALVLSLQAAFRSPTAER